MGLTLDQLLNPPDRDAIRTLLLRALQGVGFTQRAVGFAPGSVIATGVPSVDLLLVVKVVTAGQVGTAQVQVSTDGGVSFGSTTTVPSNGLLAVSGTGVTLLFSNGPSGVAESFHLGNQFGIQLNVSNFQPTSWQPGATGLTLLETDAQVTEDVYTLAKVIAAGGFLDYAVDDWVDLLIGGFYDLGRQGGVFARHALLLTDVGGAGPFVQAAGTLWARSTSGRLFFNESALTIPQSSNVTATFKAERVGQAYNVALSTINALATPIAGVTVNNPDAGDGTSILTTGADVESASLYKSRARARWPSLGPAQAEPADVYDLWARTASAEVTRTTVRPSLTVPGEIEIYLAGPTGPVSGGAVTTVDAYIQPRILLTGTAVVASAAAHPITITADVYVQAGLESQVAIECAANLDALIGALPVGGTLYLSNIIEQLSLPAGVRNVTVTLPATDVALAATEVATLTQALTFHTV